MSELPPGLLSHLANLPKQYGLPAQVSPYGTLDTSHPWTPSDSFPSNYMALSQANGGGFAPLPQPPQRPSQADLMALLQAQHSGGSMTAPTGIPTPRDSVPLPPSRPQDLGMQANTTPTTSPGQGNAQSPIGNGFQNFFDRVRDPRGPIGALIQAGVGLGQGVAPVIEQAGGGLRDILDHIFHPQG